MNTREKQKAKREEEILMAALQLFTKKGYAATKTNEISKKLQISDGLLFHYFKSKECLLETLVDIALKESNGWTYVEDIEPLDYFYQAAKSVIECMKEDDLGAHFFMLISQLKQNEGTPQHIAEKIRRDEEENSTFIMDVLKKGQEQGTIRKGNPVALLNLFIHTLQSIATQSATNKDMVYPEVEWILAILQA